MALINIGTDSWSLELEACQRLSCEIMEQLHARDKEQPGTFSYDSISGRARVRLRQFCNEVGQLQEKLNDPETTPAITSDEKERRSRQIEQLQSKLIQLERAFLKGRENTLVSAGTSGWADDDDDNANSASSSAVERNMSLSDARAAQAQAIKEQDAGLEELSQIIARQKRIAVVINEEVEDQNALLDEISTSVDLVDTRIRGETNQVTSILQKNSTCGYWVAILLLLAAIIGVIAAPGR